MKNTFIALIFTIIIPPVSALAQKPIKGFIVTLENDTLQGFIIDRIDAKLSSGVEFSKEVNGEKKSYLPSALKGFGFHNGRVFKKVTYTDKSGNF